LIHTTTLYTSPEISHAEEQMGQFLLASSNTEYTSSAGAMEKTGKLLCSMSAKRLIISKYNMKIFVNPLILEYR